MSIVAKAQRLWRPFVLLAFTTLPLLLIFCFRIVSSYSYDNDYGRDLVDIFDITKGDITLLGPKLSFGGLHTGPYYYYLFTPVLFLFPGQPEALLYANAMLAWVALVLVGVVWHKLEKWPLYFTLLSMYWIGLSSYYLFSAREPGNAFSYIGWLVFLIGVFPQIWKRSNWWLWGLYGLGWGIVVNFHLAVLFVATPLLISLAGSAVWCQKITWKRLTRLIALFFGFILSFAPLVLFEFTHNFVMIRNTFIDKSYQAFTNNSNLINPLKTSTNPIENFWLFVTQAGSWIVPSLVVLLVLVVLNLILNWKHISNSTKNMSVSVVISLGLVAVLATSQLAFHYFFPFVVLTQIVIILICAHRRIGLGVLGLALLLSLIYFPKQWFGPSLRPIEEFRSTIHQLNSSSLQSELASHSFQVYVTREVSTAPIGHEYRYFLRTLGLVTDEPSAFGTSERILWIAEQPLVDINAVTSWELDQFGSRQLLQQYAFGSRTVYLFGHK